jgi:hypothetical protein
VEADHGKTTPGDEHVSCQRKYLCQRIQLPIDYDAQSLKRASCRMYSSSAALHRTRYDFGESARSANRTSGGDRLGYATCVPFLTIPTEYSGQLFAREGVHELRGRRRVRRRIKPHIKRAVNREPKAPHWVTDLVGGQPEIEQYAIRRDETVGAGDVAEGYI